MFFSKMDKRPKRIEHLHQREKPEYIETINNNRKTLKKTGKSKDVYAITQSYKNEVDIENIIRAVALGDVRGLTQQEPIFMDVTGLPTTYAEALQSIIKMENVFNSLPLDVRKQYNFSKEEFISDFGSPRFARALGISPKEEQKPADTFQPPKTETEVK